MRTRSAVVLIAFLSTLIPLTMGAAEAAPRELSFANPIDAVSVRVSEDATAQAVSGWNGTAWLPWQELAIEDEQDPLTRESNLVMFPLAVSKIRFRQDIPQEDVHVIRISHAPAKYLVATTGSVTRHILSRDEWGADPSLMIAGGSTSSTDTNANGDNDTGVTGQAASARLTDCQNAYRNYPDEFKASVPVTKNAQGQKLLWPQQYSPQVKLLVVHHTALTVTGDPRTGVERMRALYQYHAVSRGWGDVGYHFVIDETGQIYEGRAGGDYVVGGHAYCNNVGTIGVSLMGNFDKEQPPQAQIASLQWLLQLLAQKYHIDPNHNVMFHGKSLPPIVGHRQLVSTECPGLYLWSVLDQIRAHVAAGAVDATVDYPVLQNPLPPPSGTGGDTIDTTSIKTAEDGLATLGDTTIEGRPGGQIIIPVFFRAANKTYPGNTRIARVTRPPSVQVWQERDGAFAPVLGDLKVPVPLLKQGESVLLRMKVQLPPTAGATTLKVGSITYMLQTSGRRVRSTQLLSSRQTTQTLAENGTASSAARPQATRPVTVQLVSTEPAGGDAHMIRILLTNAVPAGTQQTNITAAHDTDVNGTTFPAGTIRLQRSGGGCTATSGGQTLTADAIRLNPGDTVLGTPVNGRSYRGVLECRVVNGNLALINELPLESYLAGLAEEPDTEPYEKQRAFAITARTYALYYLDPEQRKFPGKPYDGEDSPATFQSYQGYGFETANTQWQRAVATTASNVLAYQGSVIKPPYFSSDDGRTRTPAEAGWSSFPFAQIYTSKPDPWCSGKPLSGHGVGMSGCGAAGQARDGKSAEEILAYYYPGTTIEMR